MFESPEAASNLARCRTKTHHILQYVASTPHALESLKSVADHNFFIFAHAVRPVTALSLIMHDKLFDLEQDEIVDVGLDLCCMITA